MSNKFNNLEDVIYVTGHNGLVGRSLIKILKKRGFKKIITTEKNEINLINQNSVNDFFQNNKIDQVFLVAAKVGGILANINYPKDFLYENLMIQCNILNACNESNIQKVLFFGSSCIYPAKSKIPIKESYILNGKFETTNQFYAIAKIAGLKLCESINIQFNRNYKIIMPTNIYGPNDNFIENENHVMPALISRFHNAVKYKKNSVEVWGNGKPFREFIYVDDLSEAALILMNNEIRNNKNFHFNVGSGEEISIFNLAKLIAKIAKYKGKIIFNTKKPSGVNRKLLDSSKIKKLGWYPKVNLVKGVNKTYKLYLKK